MQNGAKVAHWRCSLRCCLQIVILKGYPCSKKMRYIHETLSKSTSFFQGDSWNSQFHITTCMLLSNQILLIRRSKMILRLVITFLTEEKSFIQLPETRTRTIVGAPLKVRDLLSV